MVTIEILPDDVLLEIFAFCVEGLFHLVEIHEKT